jgi:hypothetical protein
MGLKQQQTYGSIQLKNSNEKDESVLDLLIKYFVPAVIAQVVVVVVIAIAVYL